jgi:hypothetical protein
VKSNKDIAAALVKSGKSSPASAGDGEATEDESADGLTEATQSFGEAVSSKDWVKAASAYQSMHDICSAAKGQSEEAKGEF